MSSFSKSAESEPKYKPLEAVPLMEENSDSEADLPLLRRRNAVARIRAQVPWILSGVLLVLLAASWSFRWSQACGISSFERGFSTELGKALAL